MATLSPSTAKTKDPRNPQRPPPPSLFLGPPSRNASNISINSLKPTLTNSSNLTAPSASGQPRATLLRNRSTRGAGVGAEIPILTSPLGRSAQQQRQQQQHQSEGDRTDALWAEMQATLAEVELSATRGTHFFGPDHASALEELRIAQISLAQAWARSEADEIIDHPTDNEGDNIKAAELPGQESGAGRSEGKGLQDDTAEDILLARKRREANDKYFRRINSGVLDVVARLEEVAIAMGKVERESREVWSESESMETGSGSSKA